MSCSCDCAEKLEVALFDLNYWYWRAVDPEAHARRMREIMSDFDAQQFRNEQAKRWAALDAEERAKA